MRFLASYLKFVVKTLNRYVVGWALAFVFIYFRHRLSLLELVFKKLTIDVEKLQNFVELLITRDERSVYELYEWTSGESKDGKLHL